MLNPMPESLTIVLNVLQKRCPRDLHMRAGCMELMVPMMVL